MPVQMKFGSICFLSYPIHFFPGFFYFLFCQFVFDKYSVDPVMWNMHSIFHFHSLNSCSYLLKHLCFDYYIFFRNFLHLSSSSLYKQYFNSIKIVDSYSLFIVDTLNFRSLEIRLYLSPLSLVPMYMTFLSMSFVGSI